MLNRIGPALIAAALLPGFVTVQTGCGPTAPRTQERRELLRDRAQLTVREMTQEDPSLRDFLNNRAHAYMVFPEIGKGGVIVGGAHGRGVVYRQGQPIGFAQVQQANLGLILGAETFAEIVAFEREGDLREFMNRGEFTLGGSAQAVFLKAGVGAKTNFQNGAVAFVKPRGGLIADLSVAGQRFLFSRSEPPADSGARMEGDTDAARQSAAREPRATQRRGATGGVEIDRTPPDLAEERREQQQRGATERGADLDADVDADIDTNQPRGAGGGGGARIEGEIDPGGATDRPAGEVDVDVDTDAD